MLYPLDDTIVAIASARGGAPRGIVRISGPATGACLQCLLPEGALPASKRAVAIVTDLNIAPVAPLPANVYVWPSGQSYTGQAGAEIHTLGSPPLLEYLVETLCAAGARLAEPGEFTLRAFLSGRIDLTQAEAVLGAIDAVGSHQLDAALVQLAGGLAGPLRSLRDMLLELLAHLEAGFDFADEDLPFLDADQLQNQLQHVRTEIERVAQRMIARRESGTTVRVVLAGPPNAGKSSLFNALAADVGALVSDVPGTTRDYLTADLNLDGVTCRLIDTAGMAPHGQCAADDLDQTAQEVARHLADEADVLLFCQEAVGREPAATPPPRPRKDSLAILVHTKADLADWRDAVPASVATSVPTGEGIKELENRIREAVVEVSMGEGDVVVGTALRCRESLRGAAASLERAADLAAAHEGEELVAADMRAALDALGQVVGAVYTDDLLDRIFSRFCVGK
jgi:tRNA modification GTPase